MKRRREIPQTQSTNWVFTLNNYTEDEVMQIGELCLYPQSWFEKSAAIVRAIAYAHEVGGKNNTPHLQGYLQTDKKGIK